MRLLQRLFGKGYGVSPPELSEPMPWQTSPSGSPAYGWSVILVAVALGASLLALPLTAALDVTPSAVVPSIHPWASNDTGRVVVTFQYPFPNVSLEQDANQSVVASLQVDSLEELTPVSSDHPSVVAVADPLSLSEFNGTQPPTGPGPWSFNLSADLAVRSATAGLWNGSSAPPTGIVGSVSGIATLNVNYTVEPAVNGTVAVSIGWTIGDWPWHSATDVLALESHFAMTPADELWTCTGPSVLEDSVGACSGQQLPGSGGAIVWSDLFSGVEAANGTGPIAAVTWAPTLGLAGSVAGSAHVTAGVNEAGSGAGEIVVGGVGDGASEVTGHMTIALASHPPPIPALPRAIWTGDAIVYGGSAAVFAVLASFGILGFRRRSRRALEEL